MNSGARRLITRSTLDSPGRISSLPASIPAIAFAASTSTGIAFLPCVSSSNSPRNSGVSTPGGASSTTVTCFRTVEDLLLTKKVDVALCVADALPRSISRKVLVSAQLVCLYDSRFRKLPKKPSERDYFACEHVAVSYAADARGVIEDATGKTRLVRVSVPSFSYVADVLEGTALVATVPSPLAQHVARTRPHLKSAPLPVTLELPQLELLWLRSNDDAPLSQFLRALLERIVREQLPR